MNKNTVLAALLGVAFGFLLCLGYLSVIDRSPNSYAAAIKPLVEAAGVKGYTVGALKRAINPCIVPGPLPYGCEEYVVNGEFLQPPIKVIRDKDKEKQAAK